MVATDQTECCGIRPVNGEAFWHRQWCEPLFLAALVVRCFLGALPPVDFRAVCFVRTTWRLDSNGVEES